MSVPAAYLGVIIVWSTTPLAIQWSSAGWGFMFGLAGRMLIGAGLCLVIVLALRLSLPWNRAARQTYLAAGLGIYGAMMCTYWGAQYIPSGLISVIFGLTPIMTGVIGMLFLRDERMTMLKFTGMLCGVLGLYWIFAADIEVGPRDYLGILAVLLSVLLHSVSAVWVKRVHAELPALTTTTGALLLVLPLYFLTWLLVDGEPPAEITWRASVSLLYLGVFGSVAGFILFYYVLKHLEASRVALITLITPVFALGLGMLLNAERLTLEMAWGIGGILLGLAIYQWGDVLLEKNRPRGPSSI